MLFTGNSFLSEWSNTAGVGVVRALMIGPFVTLIAGDTYQQWPMK